MISKREVLGGEVRSPREVRAHDGCPIKMNLWFSLATLFTIVTIGAMVLAGCSLGHKANNDKRLIATDAFSFLVRIDKLPVSRGDMGQVTEYGFTFSKGPLRQFLWSTETFSIRKLSTGGEVEIFNESRNLPCGQWDMQVRAGQQVVFDRLNPGEWRHLTHRIYATTVSLASISDANFRLTLKSFLTSQRVMNRFVKSGAIIDRNDPRARRHVVNVFGCHAL